MLLLNITGRELAKILGVPRRHQVSIGFFCDRKAAALRMIRAALPFHQQIDEMPASTPGQAPNAFACQNFPDAAEA